MLAETTRVASTDVRLESKFLQKLGRVTAAQDLVAQRRAHGMVIGPAVRRIAER